MWPIPNQSTLGTRRLILATLKYFDDSKEIPDGTPMQETAEELGVAFGCKSGMCGTCTVVVLEGMENISPPTEQEVDLALDDDERLMCQCTITGGAVVIES